jgi:hypothetical protein
MNRCFAAARDAVGEEPMAAGGVQVLQKLIETGNAGPNRTESKRKLKSIFTTAHDAIG